MSDLVSLKSHILNRLKEHWQESNPDQNNRSFQTLRFPIEPVSLSRLAGHIPAKRLCYWESRDGHFEVLGIGAAASIRGAHWDQVIQDHLSENPHLIFIGGLPFDFSGRDNNEWSDFGQGLFTLPLFCLVRRGNSYQARINIKEKTLGNPAQQMQTLLEIENSLNFVTSQKETLDIQGIQCIPDSKDWNQWVERACEEFEKCRLKKVVLSRKRVLKLNNTPRAGSLIGQIKKSGSYAFLLQNNDHSAFLSVSPEKLFSIKGTQIELDALAGTCARGTNRTEDQNLSDQLLSCPKERHEHHIVVESIVNSLKNLGAEVFVPTAPAILKLEHIQHLHTPIKATLKNSLTISEILARLHPTPAVGGMPPKEAVDFIAKVENFDRGLYAGPIGVITAEGAEFAVGIRSALLSGNEMHVFGGAGIVEGSVGEREWIETENKMKNFKVFAWDNTH